MRVAAVDLGASSGRVMVADCNETRITMREVHRFPNLPVRTAGVLRWDVLAIFRGVLDGLQAADRDGAALRSVGVDGWGVDYGELDADGQLVGNPVHYRDARSTAAARQVLQRIAAADLYRATGTQLQPFNTIFRLAADTESSLSDSARQVLLIPDLMNYWLTGRVRTELTNASTTGMLDPHAAAWSKELTASLALPVERFGQFVTPGEDIGPMLTEVLQDAGLRSTPHVVAAPSHDTAAAVAGLPTDGGNAAFVCSGTWNLVGMSLARPVLTEAARLANFTNERAADGSTRLLRNVTGFWLVQECLRDLRASGLTVTVAELMGAARAVPALRALINVQDPVFAAPGGMARRVVDAALRTSGVALESPAEIMRCILDSMAVGVRRALRDATEVANRPVEVINLVGGGAAGPLFCQLVADAAQLPVVAGPVEAASWGNALTQARALGIIGGSDAEGRALLRRSVRTTTYRVRDDESRWLRAEQLVDQAGTVLV